MRLTVRLDDDVYTAALALAQSERISIAKAINRLARLAIQGTSPKRPARQGQSLSRFPTSPGKRLTTSQDVRQVEEEED